MTTSDTWTGALVKALAKARGEFEPIEKTKKTHVGRDIGGKDVPYASLDDTISAITPALCANDLTLTQWIGGGDGLLTLTTRLDHSSGEWLSEMVCCPIAPDMRAVGGQITYLRRYSMSCLGVCPEDDDDAEDVTKAQQRQAQRKPTETPPQRVSDPVRPPAPAPTQEDPAEAHKRAGKAVAAASTESGFPWSNVTVRHALASAALGYPVEHVRDLRTDELMMVRAWAINHAEQAAALVAQWTAPPDPDDPFSDEPGALPAPPDPAPNLIQYDGDGNVDAKATREVFRGLAKSKGYSLKVVNPTETVKFLRHLVPDMPASMTTEEMGDTLWQTAFDALAALPAK